MPGTLRQLAEEENRRWRIGRVRAAEQREAQRAERQTQQVLRRIESARSPAVRKPGAGWVAYVPLSGQPAADFEDPKEDFDFVEATAVPTAIVVCFAWRLDGAATRYLLIIPFDSDEVDLDGGAVTVLEQIAFRVLHDPDWRSRTVPFGPSLRLIAPATDAGA